MVTATGRRATARGFRFRGENLCAILSAMGWWLALALALVGCGRVGFASGADAHASDAADAPAPPPSFVQYQNGHTNTQAATVTFGSAIQAHSTIIACFDFNSTTVSALPVTDSLGNAYQTIVGPYDRTGFRHYIAIAENTAAGTDTLTIAADQFTSMQIYLHEYTGLAPSNAVDQIAMAIGTSTAVDAMASGFAVTTSAPELLFGYAEMSGRGSAGTGFMMRSNLDGNVTEDAVADTPGTYQAVATMEVGGAEWSMILVTFRGP